MTLLFFLYGLIFGSFLNAVIHRLYVGKTIVRDRSVCPHCNHILGAWDLIPLVSFLYLRGRCRYCGKKISLQYPLIELLTGVVFALIGSHYNFGFTLDLVIALIFACVFIVIAVYDLRHFLILDKVVFPGVLLAFVYKLYLGYMAGNILGLHSPVVQGLFGVLIVSGFFLAQFVFSSGKWIGFGDVKFGILLGLLFGVGQSIVLLLVSYFLGALVGVLLILAYGKKMSSRLPFGTFLGLSAIIIMIYGTRILSWYLGVIGL